MGIFGNSAVLLLVSLWSPASCEIVTPEVSVSFKSVPRPTLKKISVFDTGLNTLIYTNVLVSSLYSFMGGVECTGVEGLTGLLLASPFPSLILGELLDFGGKTICKLSCSGDCVPYPDRSPPVGPVSLYPFGCDCSPERCNADGPIPPPHFLPGTMNSCDRSNDCTCGNLPHAANTYTGYICNWWNPANGDYIYIKYNATYSPVRWCNCCPKNRTTISGVEGSII